MSFLTGIPRKNRPVMGKKWQGPKSLPHPKNQETNKTPKTDLHHSGLSAQVGGPRPGLDMLH